MKFHSLATVGLVLAALAFSASQAQAAAPSVRDICQADFQKLCPTAKPARGAVMRCVKTRLGDVSTDCKAAVTAAQEKTAARKASRLAAAKSPSSNH
jgi:hypothetical protein